VCVSGGGSAADCAEHLAGAVAAGAVAAGAVAAGAVAAGAVAGPLPQRPYGFRAPDAARAYETWLTGPGSQSKGIVTHIASQYCDC